MSVPFCLSHVPLDSKVVRLAHDYIISVHIDAFQVMFVASAGIALLGAISCFVLVRKSTRVAQGPIFGRRSRWILANTGRTPAVTRHPPTPDRA